MNKAPDAATRNAAIIVAHPDDETLWAGGTNLSHPAWHWYVVTLCRGSDPDRAPRFFRALREFGATGAMADLDDGPDQAPLSNADVEAALLPLLPASPLSLVLSHDPAGEYTRHVRHEEVARAVITMWGAGRLNTEELWTFAYEDGGKRYLPRAIDTAPISTVLPDEVWRKKHALITDIYGFQPDGFEAQTTPRTEAFWRFTRPSEAISWLQNGGGYQ